MNHLEVYPVKMLALLLGTIPSGRNNINKQLKICTPLCLPEVSVYVGAMFFGYDFLNILKV